MRFDEGLSSLRDSLVEAIFNRFIHVIVIVIVIVIGN